MLHALPHVAYGDEVDLDSSGHWLPEHHRHVGGTGVNPHFFQLTALHERRQSQASRLLFCLLPARQRPPGRRELDEILEAHQADAGIFEEAE